MAASPDRFDVVSTSTVPLSRSAGHRRPGLGLAYVSFAGLGLVWGVNFIFVKWALPYIDPAQIVLLRVLFGFLPLLVVALATRSLRWQHWRHVHHFAVMAVLATVFYYLAFAKGTALLLSSVAGMLSGAIPLFTFVTALVFLRQEPINVRSIGGTVLGFLGVLLIARPWNQSLGAVNVAGVLWMIAGSFSVGCSFVYAKRFITPLGLSPLALTTYQIALALLILLAVTDLHGINAVFGNTRAWLGLVLGLGLCGTGLAYIAYYLMVDRLGAVMASGVTYIPPVVALVVGALLASEPVKMTDIVAMAAILTGVAVLQSGRKRSGQRVGA
jgi:drug/metabolite transporter (DMT)-like permease